MSFDMKIKFEGKLVQKAKAENIEEFDSVINGLKEKFGTKPKGRN